LGILKRPKIGHFLAKFQKLTHFGQEIASSFILSHKKLKKFTLKGPDEHLKICIFQSWRGEV